MSCKVSGQAVYFATTKFRARVASSTQFHTVGSGLAGTFVFFLPELVVSVLSHLYAHGLPETPVQFVLSHLYARGSVLKLQCDHTSQDSLISADASGSVARRTSNGIL